MSTTRYASVLGLGFGDCGKGLFVDALTRRWQAHTVVRFNGGGQAGHNVVTPADADAPSKHHTFSHFGAGTFVPRVRTVLVDPMIVHPTALLVEAEALFRAGVRDVLGPLMIDARCRMTTPFHQAAGRLRELLRGTAAHGTCGVGVGETVRHGLEHPDQELRYADLAHEDAGSLVERLQAIRETLLAEFSPLVEKESSAAIDAELQLLQDETVAEKWAARVRPLGSRCRPVSFDRIRLRLTQPGCVLFEGAQGVLLDEWRGFHPHTTWSSINTDAVEAVARRFGIEAPIEHYGVMRTYLTRHGAGPLPTEDGSLNVLPEPHNTGDGWQGTFRRGHPDAVLLRYALEAAGRLSGLLISHLDVFRKGVSLKWCEGYSIEPRVPQWPESIEQIPVGVNRDLDHQLSLTRLLQNARPKYAAEPIRSAPDFLERISSVSSVGARFCSFGPTCADVCEV
jgi:adenylosuccinate synthase